MSLEGRPSWKPGQDALLQPDQGGLHQEDCHRDVQEAGPETEDSHRSAEALQHGPEQAARPGTSATNHGFIVTLLRHNKLECFISFNDFIHSRMFAC